VTIGSLVVAAVITYLLIAILSWRQGYRLSLSGVAGLIVAIGITADSFIVYFERVRDELRDGRTLSAAVEAGWSRAIRTILVSDGVSMLAAVVLFALTVGSVKGFAFTLGLTTLVDLAVVALFTHPMLQVLAQRKFFSSGNKWSGFDSKALGGHIYVGRGKFTVADTVSDAKRGKASKEAEKRQTIAERKAAANQNNGGQN
jgi:preprotein translocase subunit SecD